MIVQAWCPHCHETVIPMPNGKCGWCDHQTGAADVLPATTPAPKATATQLHKGDPGWGPECACGRAKSVGSHKCIECRRAAGWRGGTPKGRHLSRNMTAAQAEQARELYATGLSLRQVAGRIWQDTGYVSQASCAEALYSMFSRRGWPLRSRRDALVDRNWKHGRASGAQQKRADADYREYRREQRTRAGIRQGKQCAGIKTQPPGMGRRCERPALKGGDYCQSHDPIRAAARETHLARMRATPAAVEARARRSAKQDEKVAAILGMRARGETWTAIAKTLGYKSKDGPKKLLERRGVTYALEAAA